jgi:hypothetical protein
MRTWCDGDGLFDWFEINNDMDLDIDRTVVLIPSGLRWNTAMEKN